MNIEPNYEFRADLKKNRLYIILKGFFPEDLAAEAAEKVIVEANKLQPGFDIVNDITLSKPTTSKGAEQIQRVQAFVKERGVKRIVRVVDPKNVLARVQFERTSKDAGYDVKVEVVGSLAEADKLLDGE